MKRDIKAVISSDLCIISNIVRSKEHIKSTLISNALSILLQAEIVGVTTKQKYFGLDNQPFLTLALCCKVHYPRLHIHTYFI
jgi:hypothetical protein